MDSQAEPQRRVFILGAGASVFAGYPLAADLPGFLRRNTQGADVTTGRLANEVLTKLEHAASLLHKQTRKTWDFETLLTHLDLYGNIGNLGMAFGVWNDDDRMKVGRAIAYAFQWHQVTCRGMIWGRDDPREPGINDQRSVVSAWGELVKPGDIIISFNWDLLHEAILWRAKKWSYVDGYGFTLSKVSPEEPLSKTYIYKLHGSVNWVQEYDTDEVTELGHTRDWFLQSHPPPRGFPPKTTGLDSGRKLILPTYLKDISRNRALLRVWRLAQDSLRKATEICVIGYSLNPADHPARLLLGTELGRNDAVQEITLISPSAGGWSDFLYRLGKPLKHIKMSFEDWVQTHGH
jgi:hypothetical protein